MREPRRGRRRPTVAPGGTLQYTPPSLANCSGPRRLAADPITLETAPGAPIAAPSTQAPLLPHIDPVVGLAQNQGTIMDTVRAPRVSSNDGEVVVTAIHVHVGEVVRAGQPLLTIEASKVSMDVCAEHDCLIQAVLVELDQTLAPGDPLLTTSPLDDASPAPPSADRPHDTPDTGRTRRAALPASPFGRLDDVAQPRSGPPDIETRAPRPSARRSGLPAHITEQHIVLIGAGGHARAVVDLLRLARRDLTPLGALDDLRPPGSDVLGVPVLGPLTDLEALADAGLGWALVAIGALQRTAWREELYQRVTALGLNVPTLVHPRAIVEASARLGAGVQVFAGAIVGSNVTVEDNVIINAGAILSHDCILHRAANIAPGAMLAGGVEVGYAALVGMGVTVHVGVRIGASAVIGNGRAIFDDVPAHAVLKARSV